MNLENELSELCEQLLSESGYELVGVEVAGLAGRRRTTRFFIDKPGGVTLDDCAGVSRMIDPLIEASGVFKGPYVIEVSSPGLDRPLVKPADYERFSGRKVRFRLARPLDGRRKFTGVLHGMDDRGCVMIELEGGQQVRIPLDLVSRSNLVFEWK
ncbi:MAG: ribosome maturation factor RimP [Gemmatimonadota bacterium]|nr:ribosome maturation factor RimP [Gemmatimonadota bacterium]